MLKWLLNRTCGSSLPRGLLLFTFGEFWDRFSFYGSLTLLILYLTHFFSFSEHRAYAIWGEYCALGFVTPVLGGFIADKWFGLLRTCLLGYIAMILGFFLLLYSSYNHVLALYAGLTFNLIGVGLYKGNISSLVGTLYKQDDSRRDSGFTFFSMGMISGGLLGPLVYGLLVQAVGWTIPFALSMLGIMSNLFWFLLQKSKIQFETLPPIPAISNRFFSEKDLILFICFFLSLLFVGINIALYYSIWGNTVLFALTSILLFGFGIFAVRRAKDKHATIKIGILFLLNLFAAMYFAASFQVNGSIVIFITNHVDTNVLGFHVPATSFSSLEALSALMFSPLILKLWQILNKRNIKISAFHKMIFGLALVTIAFLAFAMTSIQSSTQWLSWIWLFMGNFLLGLSGVLILPALMSMVSQYAPPSALGTVMGLSFLIDALGGFLGNRMATWGMPTEGTATYQQYAHMFLYISGTLFISMILVSIVTPIIDNLLKGSELCQQPSFKIT